MLTKYFSVADVPSVLHDDMLQFSYGIDGFLYKDFHNMLCFNDGRSGIVVTYHEGYRFAGWGMLTNYCDYGNYDNTLMIYVAMPFRHLGIGTKIAESLLKEANGTVFVWVGSDQVRKAFFKSLAHPLIKYNT